MEIVVNSGEQVNITVSRAVEAKYEKDERYTYGWAGPTLTICGDISPNYYSAKPAHGSAWTFLPYADCGITFDPQRLLKRIQCDKDAGTYYLWK